MSEIISMILIAVGVTFMFIAGIGLLRMPDIFLRMSGATKAATLGVGCIIAAVAVYFGDLATVVRAIGVIIFLLVTAPVAAHLIGRAAYIERVDLWQGTLFDDLKPFYRSKSETGE